MTGVQTCALPISSKRKVREAYREQSQTRRARTAAMIRSTGVDLLEFTSGTNWLPALVNFFRKRRQRIG